MTITVILLLRYGYHSFLTAKRYGYLDTKVSFSFVSFLSTNMSYKKITVNVTYVITQYTFATTHICALINENPQVTTRTVTGSRHVLITVTAVTVILIGHSGYYIIIYTIFSFHATIFSKIICCPFIAAPCTRQCIYDASNQNHGFPQ